MHGQILFCVCDHFSEYRIWCHIDLKVNQSAGFVIRIPCCMCSRFSEATGSGFTCTEGGQNKINPTNDLRLRASCSAACVDVTYEWQIDFYNGSLYMPLENWESYASGDTTVPIYFFTNIKKESNRSSSSYLEYSHFE